MRDYLQDICFYFHLKHVLHMLCMIIYYDDPKSFSSTQTKQSNLGPIKMLF